MMLTHFKSNIFSNATTSNNHNIIHIESFLSAELQNIFNPGLVCDEINLIIYKKLVFTMRNNGFTVACYSNSSEFKVFRLFSYFFYCFAQEYGCFGKFNRHK